MKDKIIIKSTELFLNLGFKSVTMDDIANEMGISKKTIYVYFKNKTKLVEAATFHLFDVICGGIDCIFNKSSNPIEELYDIKMFCNATFKKTKKHRHNTNLKSIISKFMKCFVKSSLRKCMIL